jgi:hypothetical protein
MAKLGILWQRDSAKQANRFGYFMLKCQHCRNLPDTNAKKVFRKTQVAVKSGR